MTPTKTTRMMNDAVLFGSAMGFGIFGPFSYWCRFRCCSLAFRVGMYFDLFIFGVLALYVPLYVALIFSAHALYAAAFLTVGRGLFISCSSLP